MKTFLQYGLSALMTMAITAGCQKTEFMPPPEGEKIEYVDPNLKVLGETLKASPYQLFYKAYLRSNMDSVLSGKSKFTLLTPTDAAMKAAGYTDASIAALTPAQADALVAYYTIRGGFSREELQAKPGNLEGVSLLANKKFQVSPFYYGDGTPGMYYDTYYYRQSIRVTGEQFLVNGIPSGDAKSNLAAKNGYVWPIDKMIPLTSEKTFLGNMEQDPRFSMFVEVQRKADEMHEAIYRQLTEENFGYDPYVPDYKRVDYINVMEPGYSGSYRVIGFRMMFAPTNEAFQKAGFQTVEDVLAWNKKYMSIPEPDWDQYDMTKFGFPSDTVLAYHWDFAKALLPTNASVQPRPYYSAFFVNDLRDEYVHASIPLTFGVSGDKVTVKIKGSDAPAATILETINTIQGPMHVVDRLLIPKNFKMN